MTNGDTTNKNGFVIKKRHEWGFCKHNDEVTLNNKQNGGNHQNIGLSWAVYFPEIQMPTSEFQPEPLSPDSFADLAVPGWFRP